MKPLRFIDFVHLIYCNKTFNERTEEELDLLSDCIEKRVDYAPFLLGLDPVRRTSYMALLKKYSEVYKVEMDMGVR